MTPKEQNEAIGRSIGWKSCSECGNVLCELWIPPGKWHYRDAMHLPDFTGRLGAMSTAEKHLVDDEERRRYVDCVFDLNNGGNGALRFVGRWACVTATPAQKAEAFLKAKGLWKDDEV